MKRALINLVRTLHLFVFGFVLWQYSAAFTVAGPIVISEFRFRGLAGGNDEFVELLNVSGTNVNIGGWKLMGCNNTGSSISARATNPPVILAPGEHFLLACTAYSDSVPPNQIYTTGIVDNGGIALVDTNGVIRDSVGVATTALGYREGTALFTQLTTNTNRSYARKTGGYQDTDDNTSDFELLLPSAPQNHPIVLRFESIALLTNTSVQLQCSGAPLQTYRLLAATNAAFTFLPIATNSAAGDGTFAFQDTPPPNSARFYRLSP